MPIPTTTDWVDLDLTDCVFLNNPATPTVKYGRIVTGYENEIRERHPLVYYRMGALTSSGVADDSSGNGRNGSYLGGPDTEVSGLLTADSDQAVDYLGINEYLNVPDAAWQDVTNITLSVIIRPDNVTGPKAIVSRDDSSDASNRCFNFRINSSSKLEFEFWDSGGTLRGPYASTTSLSTATIYRIGVTYDGSNVVFYLNGSADGTHAISASMRSVTQAIQIGCRRGGGSNTNDPFNGKMDEFAMWGTALSSADMLALHQSATNTLATPTPPSIRPITFGSGNGIAFNHPDFNLGEADPLAQYELEITYHDDTEYTQLNVVSRPSTGATSWWSDAGYDLVTIGALDDVGTPVLTGTLGNGLNEWPDAITDGHDGLVFEFTNRSVITGIRARLEGPTPTVGDWVTLDLTDAVFPEPNAGPPVYGEYDTGAIITSGVIVEGHDSYPDFYFPGFTLSRGVYAYEFEVTYSDAHAADADGRNFWISVFQDSDPAGSYTSMAAFPYYGIYYNDPMTGTPPDVETYLVPSANLMAPPSGWNTPWFESDAAGALTSLRYRTLSFPPPDVAPSVMTLKILDPAQKRSPTAITVTVSNATPNGVVLFEIDGDVVYRATADDAGRINALSIAVSSEYLAGSHTLEAICGSLTSSATFTLTNNPATGHVVGPDADPVEIEEAIAEDGSRRWVFQDLFPGGLGSYVFTHNPITDVRPKFERNLTARHTTGQNGRWHVNESRARWEWKITGRLFTEQESVELEDWADLNRRFYCIDDYGDAWVVAMSDLNITPALRADLAIAGEPSQHTDWLNAYEITLVVLRAEPLEPVVSP